MEAESWSHRWMTRRVNKREMRGSKVKRKEQPGIVNGGVFMV